MSVCTLTFVAQGVIRDAETNNVSAFQILEQLNSAAFPIFFHEVGFIAFLKKDPDGGDVEPLKFSVKNNKDVIHEMEVEANYRGLGKTRIVVSISGLVIPNPGTLQFSLSSGEHIVSNYVVDVISHVKPKIELKEGMQEQAHG